ncbi:NADAR family protein [Vibrio profundum]|uniref:NADAR family protein n=1 Tax=Vibrio profundum TaxID=2910247 RepID=UPI003D10B2D1
MRVQSNEQLIGLLSQGGKSEYLFFWGHQKPKSGVSKSCLSQWYDSPFQENGIHFATAEHYMMYHKATLFDGSEIAQKVINSCHPNEVKMLGRKVCNFDEEIWNRERFEIVVRANKLKFEKNPELLDFLLSTDTRVLVEASPVDKIWGIGLAADDPNAWVPKNWQGLNLLGYALMNVREQLKYPR